MRGLASLTKGRRVEPQAITLPTPYFRYGFLETHNVRFENYQQARGVPQNQCIPRNRVSPKEPRGLTPSWAVPKLHALASKRRSNGRMGDVVAGAKPGK